MMKRMMIVAISIGLTGPVIAEEAVSTWKGEAELGFLITSGNTKKEQLSARTKIENERDKWRHIVEIKALKSDETDALTDATSTSAEKYELTAKSDYKFKEFNYLFVVVNYEDDKFSGYDYRASEAIGYGNRLIHRENLTLDLEGGPGVRQSESDAGAKKDESMLRLSGKLEWKASKTAKFNQELTSEVGEDITITKSVSALRNQVNGDLSSVLTLTVRNVSDVPVGVKETDTETTLALVYSF